MKPETSFEKELREWREGQLRSHRWRVANWEAIKQFWIPQGLTCPNCHADHCEVDGHSC